MAAIVVLVTAMAYYHDFGDWASGEASAGNQPVISRDSGFYGANAGTKFLHQSDLAWPIGAAELSGDFAGEVRVRVDEVARGNAGADLIFLRDGEGRYYSFGIYPGEHRWQLFDSTRKTVVARGYEPEGIEMCRWYVLRVKVSDGIIRLYIDGVEKTPTEGIPANIDSGGIALRVRSSDALFDDFSVQQDGSGFAVGDDFSGGSDNWNTGTGSLWTVVGKGDEAAYRGNVLVGASALMSKQVSPEFSDYFDMMEKSGAGYIRIFFSWRDLQPQDADHYYWDYMDAMMIAAHDRGIDVLANVLDTPSWAVAAVNRSQYDAYAFPPEQNDDLERFVQAVVARYGPGGELSRQQGWDDGYGITAYEIGPEYNVGRIEASGPMQFTGWMGDLDQYVDYLKAGHDGVKALCSQCLVLSGGAADNVSPEYQAQTDPSGTRQYLWQGVEDLYRAIQSRHPDDPDAADRYFDVLNIHTYQWFTFSNAGRSPDSFRNYSFPDAYWYRDRINNVIGVMERYGDADKKIWLTEVAYASEDNGDPNRGYLPESGQSGALKMIYRESGRFPQVERVFWWSGVDGCTYSGLLRRDLSPKPAFRMFTVLSHRNDED